MRQLTLRPILPILMACLLLAGCQRDKPERASTAGSSVKLDSCAPADEADERLTLAISAVTIEPEGTMVKIAATATGQAVEFDLPVYWLSRGRWLIGKSGRAYLIDQECREYKLKDRKSGSAEKLPLDGRIRLNPGQTFEAVLIFPRLPDRIRAGALVYGNRTLAFTIGT